LVGSAQARRRRVVLQHGAIPLEGDITRIADLLVLSDLDRQMLRADLLTKATTLQSAVGRAVSYQECVAALCKGFSRALHLTLEQGELAADERTAMELLRVKHVKREWLFDKRSASRQMGQDG
jgi:lipoate-protein ligase A